MYHYVFVARYLSIHKCCRGIHRLVMCTAQCLCLRRSGSSMRGKDLVVSRYHTTTRICIFSPESFVSFVRPCPIIIRTDKWALTGVSWTLQRANRYIRQCPISQLGLAKWQVLAWHQSCIIPLLTMELQKKTLVARLRKGVFIARASWTANNCLKWCRA